MLPFVSNRFRLFSYEATVQHINMSAAFHSRQSIDFHPASTPMVQGFIRWLHCSYVHCVAYT